MAKLWQLALTAFKRLMTLRMVAWSPLLVVAVVAWWVVKALLGRRSERSAAG